MNSDEKRKYLKPEILRKLTFFYKFLSALPFNAQSDMVAVKKTINLIRYKKRMPSSELLIYYDALYKRYLVMCDTNHTTQDVLARMNSNESAQ